MATYICPACGAHLDVDSDILEGDGERLKGFVEKDWAVTCGTCAQARPAKAWVDATRAAGFPVKTPLPAEVSGAVHFPHGKSPVFGVFGSPDPAPEEEEEAAGGWFHKPLPEPAVEEGVAPPQLAGAEPRRFAVVKPEPGEKIIDLMEHPLPPLKFVDVDPAPEVETPGERFGRLLHEETFGTPPEEPATDA